MKEKTDKQAWLDRAYAVCKQLGHHVVGSEHYHNGACQEGYQATAPNYSVTATPEKDQTHE